MLVMQNRALEGIVIIMIIIIIVSLTTCRKLHLQQIATAIYLFEPDTALLLQGDLFSLTLYNYIHFI